MVCLQLLTLSSVVCALDAGSYLEEFALNRRACSSIGDQMLFNPNYFCGRKLTINGQTFFKRWPVNREICMDIGPIIELDTHLQTLVGCHASQDDDFMGFGHRPAIVRRSEDDGHCIEGVL